VAIGQLVVNKHRDGIVLGLQPLPHRPGLGLWDLESGPAVPLEARRFGQAAQAGDEATRGHGEGVLAIVGALDGDGQAIGYQEKTADGLVVNEAGHGDPKVGFGLGIGDKEWWGRETGGLACVGWVLVWLRQQRRAVGWLVACRSGPGELGAGLASRESKGRAKTEAKW